MATYTAPDGCRIHYETFGETGPRVLLIPGLGGDGRFWGGVVQRLQTEFRLVVADHRGAGRSDRPPGGYSIPRSAADVAGIVHQWGEPVHVVGHSTGGAIAQVLALDHDIKGLSYTISSSWARSDARFRTLFIARAEMLEAGQAETYQRLTHVFGHTSAWLTAHAAKLDAAVADAPRNLAPLDVAAARVRMLLDHDRLADLSSIRSPVQVIAAVDDILTPPELSRAVATAIAGAEFVTVRGAHFHPFTDPDSFAAEFRRFIAKL
ncbi:alpha/beta fold hydrolase [Mycoplana rhizolycopersici]|uniref:Alpha/beta fold hydrolase n=1 Tax=Mycoplana rhizolycopersici TaxID=2746702 RepID=A0ABX2QI53_9HYPH|nr:alpha/beta hydrolase [Rhizobium rhizolycopersici]NVP57460.1 alpha/beta fold hydrolase [Rhizobium rhizolycopersici]